MGSGRLESLLVVAHENTTSALATGSGEIQEQPNPANAAEIPMDLPTEPAVLSLIRMLQDAGLDVEGDIELSPQEGMRATIRFQKRVSLIQRVLERLDVRLRLTNLPDI